MTTVAAITSAMATRPNTSPQKGGTWVLVRDGHYLYFGDDGDVRLWYETARDVLHVNDRGSWVQADGLNLGDRVTLTERFLRPPGINADIQNAAEATREIVNTDFELLGGNATSDDATIDVEGGVCIETDGGANTTDSVIILPHLDASQSAWATTTWGTDRSTRYECTLRTGTTAQSVTSTVIWVGLKLTNVDTIATDNDQVFFRSDGTNWSTVYSIGGTDTEAVALAIAQNTTYRFVINIDSSRVATMYINGVLYATSTALTNATDLIPYIGVRQNLNGVARRVYVMHCQISRLVAAS